MISLIVSVGFFYVCWLGFFKYVSDISSLFGIL